MVTSAGIGRKGIAADRTRAPGDGYLRYRLDVVAASAADVVQSVGGWLFDRARAGWSVSVLLTRGGDTRPLRILGLHALDLDSKSLSELRSTTSRMPGQSLAVSAEAFTADVRVRETVYEALDYQVTEVALWGEGWPAGVNRAVASVQHVLSPAARVFKGYALVAAGNPCEPVELTETLLYDTTDERWRA